MIKYTVVKKCKMISKNTLKTITNSKKLIITQLFYETFAYHSGCETAARCQKCVRFDWQSLTLPKCARIGTKCFTE